MKRNRIIGALLLAIILTATLVLPVAASGGIGGHVYRWQSGHWTYCVNCSFMAIGPGVDCWGKTNFVGAFVCPPPPATTTIEFSAYIPPIPGGGSCWWTGFQHWTVYPNQWNVRDFYTDVENPYCW